MSVRMKRVFALFTLVAALVGALLGGGRAVASPLLDTWVDIPGMSSSYEEAPAPDGTVYKSTVKAVPDGIEAVERRELKYGTGVLRNGVPEVGTTTVYTPGHSSGEIATYAPPTDTLDPLSDPSKTELSDSDKKMVNSLLRAGKTVIITDAYGNYGVRQYAGHLNGVRIWNAIIAYDNDNPDFNLNDPDCVPSDEEVDATPPVDAYGFSGGGIDVANLLEYRWARIRTGVIDSGPTDLAGFLRDPGAKNGLGLVAAKGAFESMAPSKQAVIWPQVRPTFQVGMKALGIASMAIPIPGLVTGLVTVGGALLPFTLESILLPGAMEDPQVREAINSISPTVGPAGRHGTVVFRYNKTDQFVPGSMHVGPLSDLYRAQGDNVRVITNHGQASPGHATMTSAQLTALLTGSVPTSDIDTFNAPLEGMDKLTSLIIGGALTGIAEWGKVLNREAPAVLDETDRLITDLDQNIDEFVPPTIPSVSAPAPTVIVPPVVPLDPVTPSEVADQAVRALPVEVREPAKAVIESPEAQSVLQHPAVKQFARDPLVQGALSLLPVA